MITVKTTEGVFIIGVEQLNFVKGEILELNDERREIPEFFKRKISQTTDHYIQQKLSSIDEDLANVQNTLSDVEGQILGLAEEKGISLTVSEIKAKGELFLQGKYTVEDVTNQLKEKEFSDRDIQTILELLAKWVEARKIQKWNELIWDKEGELEAQIDSMTLEELLQLDVRKMCEEAYAGIPLEV